MLGLDAAEDAAGPPDVVPFDAGEWGKADLARYIAWAKSAFAPVLAPAAQDLLSAYFRWQRQVRTPFREPATARYLEALVRLTQAHARLMARAEAGVPDAAAAVLLLDTCINSESLLNLGCTAPLHCVCRVDDAVMAQRTRRLLDALGLGGALRLEPAQPPPPALMPAPKPEAWGAHYTSQRPVKRACPSEPWDPSMTATKRPAAVSATTLRRVATATARSSGAPSAPWGPPLRSPPAASQRSSAPARPAALVPKPAGALGCAAAPRAPDVVAAARPAAVQAPPRGLCSASHAPAQNEATVALLPAARRAFSAPAVVAGRTHLSDDVDMSLSDEDDGM